MSQQVITIKISYIDDILSEWIGRHKNYKFNSIKGENSIEYAIYNKITSRCFVFYIDKFLAGPRIDVYYGNCVLKDNKFVEFKCETSICMCSIDLLETDKLKGSIHHVLSNEK